MKSIALAAFLFSLSACAAHVEGRPMFAAVSGSGSDVAAPVRSMLDQKFHTVVRQRYDFSCGSAALATLLHHHYAYAVDEERAFRGMWKEGDRNQIRKLGFSLLDMKRWLAAQGLRADGYKVSLDQVEKAGVPGLALIMVKNYRHFVVVKGVKKDEILVGDPSTGLHTMSRREFEAAWNGVYFVLAGDSATAKSSFNHDRQWAAYARAPIGGRFSEPLSNQALALTLPSFGDF